MEVRRISLLGNKDHGKSTLIGSLLMLTKSIPESRIQEANRASKQLGIGFEPAYLLDTFSDEREGGMTYDNSRAQILYKDIGFELIDVPGHEELIKSMLSGASNSNTSIVVVSAKKDEGITEQTKRHIFVSNLLGVSNYIVAINKMDTSNFSKYTFNKIKNELKDFFESIGISKQMFCFIPVSAYSGDNIATRSEHMLWYKENTLLEELKFRTNSTSNLDEEKGRIILQSTLKIGNNMALLGEVITGRLSKYDSLRILPGKRFLNIFELRRGNDLVETVKRGDSVALLTQSMDLYDVRGYVVTNNEQYVHVSDSLELRLFFLESPNGSLKISLNNVETPIQSISIKNVIDFGARSFINNQEIRPLAVYDLEVKLASKIACETFDLCKELGRIVMYSKTKMIAAGIITSCSAN